MIKAIHPDVKIGIHRRQGAVEPEKEASSRDTRSISFARNEFDFTIKDVADGMPWRRGSRVSRNPQMPTASIVHNEDRQFLENMDSASVGDACL